MSNFLKQEYGVAMSGVKWEIGNFKLWQSTDPNIILFTPTQPVLAKNRDGRYQFGVTQFRQQVDDTYKITGGSAIFTITSAIQFDEGEFEALKEQWLSEMRASDARNLVPQNPRFIPLNVRNGSAQLMINPVSGEPNDALLDTNIGTLGGYNSFLVHLTELGAQEWVHGVRTKSIVPVGVKVKYEYLRMMPTIGAQVKVHGERVFRHFSMDIDVSVDTFWYGGSAKIEAAWEKMIREGAIEITFHGAGLDPDLEELRQELVTTFANQAREQLFNTLFEPTPEVDDAQAGDTSGLFGGANFAFKWRKETDITDLTLDIKFEGWTWLTASMDADVTSLIKSLDESYINEVNTQMSAPASISVDADPLLENVALSWSASEGKAPESPIFGRTGGQEQYTVTSQDINNVKIDYLAKVNFTRSDWPIVTTSGSAKIKDGGNQIMIKPSSWIGRTMIEIIVVDEFGFPRFPTMDDMVIINLSYVGDHLPRPLRSSARLEPFGPLTFEYPLSPSGEVGKAKFSAFAMVDGRLIRSSNLDINVEEEMIVVTVAPTGIEVLSSSNSATGESALQSPAQRLIAAGGRPVIHVSESTPEAFLPNTNGHSNGHTNGLLEGTVIAVQYSKNGPALVVETLDGKRKVVKLHDNDEAEPFNDGRRRQVEIDLTEGDYAESIAVLL